MFGVLYAISVGIGSIISGTKGIIDNSKAYNRGEQRYQSGEDLSRTYIDRKGATRDLVSNQYVDVRRSFDSRDDDDLYVWQNGNKIRNVSELKREREFYLGTQGNCLNRTADLYDRRYWSLGRSSNAKIKGSFYKDLETGDIYVCRSFYVEKSTVLFYMSIKTGYLIRKSDTQFDYESKYPNNVVDNKAIYDFIIDFNKKQKDGGWYVAKDLDGNTVRDYYCNKFEISDHIKSLYQLKYGGKL